MGIKDLKKKYYINDIVKDDVLFCATGVTGVDLRSVRAGEVMRPKPFTVSAQALAAEAANLMEERKISSVLVLDEKGVLCGALTSNDLMRAKVI